MSRHEVVITSIVASRDHAPRVNMAIPHKDTAVQMSPDEARDLARSLIEGAHNAETDSAIFAYVTGNGGTREDAARALTLIRLARKEEEMDES
jgi:hypothetical protein